ncbi:MAG: HlyD family type I secretion periplasmic adaptor subunit [Gammaproteobacteria bacterium]|nr:HlyD family type I secretion periplasmic adaptor subunit [Gammaproteobacteria bacterium]
MENNFTESPSTHSITRTGWIVIAVFIGVFFLWAFFSSIESAAVAPGKIVVAGNRRVVQHLEGGIIAAIAVKNGDIVKKGQVLVKIDDTQSATKFESEHGQLLRLLANEARLIALIENRDHVTFPDDVLAVENVPSMHKVLDNQKTSFEVERLSKAGSLNIYKKRVLALEDEIQGANAQLASSEQQLKLVHEEVAAILVLAKEELVDRSRVLSIQRDEQQLRGQRGQYQANIASLKEKVGETELLVIAEQNKLNKEWNQELREVREKLAQSEDREKSSKDIFDRTTIVAPLDGTVMNLAVSTLGGVVKSGETLLEIVPSHEELVIEAKVNPLDIDVVHDGLKAKITLSALKTRTTPTLLGEVTYVSADAQLDERTQTSYFQARIHIDASELKKLGDKKIMPGMPVDVMIITGKHSPWTYFMDPIERSFKHSFRED